MEQSIRIARPDDWHLHLRDGARLMDVIEPTAQVFGRAIIMPNLKPPVTTVKQAANYREQIGNALRYRDIERDRAGEPPLMFDPLMTLYLTDNTPPEEVDRAKESAFVHAFKYYPAGATTNSDAGVSDLKKVDKVLERMQELGIPLLLHGEVTDPDADAFDLEKVFVNNVFRLLRRRYPALKMVLEHITTKEAVECVMAESRRDSPTAATITAHHLLENRNALFKGGMRPHNFCRPVLKREAHRQSLLWAATSGNPEFFLGTDSAPHPKGEKESACGCAGCYTAYGALPLYAEAFDSAEAIHMLEGFASHFGADFYGLPRNTETVILVREESVIPAELQFGDEQVVPFRAGEKMRWKVVR